MEMDGNVLKRSFSKLVVVLLLVLSFGTTGCSIFRSGGSETTKTDRTIWHSREQNMRIVRQDVPKGAVPVPNDHPIVLASDQIRSALGTLEVKLEDTDKYVPVFTQPELDVLSGKLSEALSQAGPDEDVTFAVIGQRKAVYGLAKQRKVTTGRVFYREGKLNIIFGKMINDIREQDDLRLKPLTPGSRTIAVDHKWTIEETPDMQFHGEAGTYRTDWVELDLAAIAAHEALGIKPTKASRAAREEAGVSRSEAVPQASRQTQAPAEPAQVVPQTGKTTKTVEERLTILNDLKNKKLITDEEYKAKRAEILKDL